MKRSQMVKVLADSFLKHSSLDKTNEEVAGFVLADLEHAGMVGPTIHWHDGEYDDLKKGLRELDASDLFEYEWEPEV